MFAGQHFGFLFAPTLAAELNHGIHVTRISEQAEVFEAAQCHLHRDAETALGIQQFSQKHTRALVAAKVLQHTALRIQESARKPVAAGLFVFVVHVVGQGHDPMAQFMRGSKAHTLAGAFAVQGNQHMLVVVGRCASAVKVIRAIQQGHFDAVAFQQFGQVSNGIVANLQLRTKFLSCQFSFLHVGHSQRLSWQDLNGGFRVKAAFQCFVPFKMVAHFFGNLALARLGHFGQLAKFERCQLDRL